ncbi:NIF3-like protein 1 [Portunus trituberculatus]|uniref:NIF3-like protein 1 n=1 Tax=Portunus trituberculatus TaxID=210409 RepID=A0A5B7D0N8_PORTR|nr:NIF3-like protein 1 [Portunus trituberculatus]
MEKENKQLRKQCDEMKVKLLEMEKKISEGDLGKEECLNLIDAKMKEVKQEHQEVQKSFREIMKKQEEENKVITQNVGEVTPLQQKDVPLPHSHQVEAALESDAAVQDLIQRVTQEVGEQVTVLKYGTNCMKVLCGERDLPAIVSLTSTNSAAPAKLVVTKLEKVPLVGHGAGRRGSLAEPITVQQAISRVKTHLGLPHLRVALAHGSTLDTQVNSVAVCAGSGVSVLRGASADLWLTGEMSHHEVLDATHGGSTVILVDHSNSERGFLKELQPTLHQLFEEKVNVLISQKDRDPLQII